ncbi:hypothetical protein F0U44_13605 [Nocardioides humilatus]|uniref:Uncharacterized protein n=1 Tax=Nocardioides humilatus TaxID=2607660 RepID=A0A5B1LFC7_9ACTN|nr:hypothetical protein [Nocardioides humilatus]KAA1419461.1 hypothetical protein F0U44_13605 [Nocardioides humilatus]
MKSHVTRRAGGLRIRLLGCLVAVVVVAGVSPSSTALAPAAGRVPERAAPDESALGFVVQLGPEQRVAGPTDQGDNPYFSEKREGKLYGYFGTSRTLEWRSHNNTRLTNSRIILDRGLPGEFDECGAWLQGSFQRLTRQHWIAFYHAEGQGPGDDTCDHYANTTVWRMAMAETTNGGLTWQRPSYPNNVVVTGTGASMTGGITNAGNGRTVRVGDYYYMFFETNHGTRPGLPGIHIARSKVSDGGARGTWKKYYCTTPASGDPVCAWSQPGIGGKSTPIGGLSEKGRYIAWNSRLSRWLGFDASGRRGFQMFASEVGTGDTALERQQSALFDEAGLPKRWVGSEDVYPLVSTDADPYVDQWGGHLRDAKSKQLYAYPSISGAEGQSCCTGGTFYVYYVKLFPGDKFTDRYLFRRKVTVTRTDRALNRVELTTYKNGKGQRRSSTEAPKPRTFKAVGAAGYLLSHAGVTGWKQVMDCTRKADHALFAGKCKSGWKPYRRIGFVRPTKTKLANVALYRCVAKRSHYVSASRSCDGGQREARIGFAMRELS